MTDRELLEKAAKAVGMGAVKPSAFRPNCYVVQTHEHEWTAWNPLTDDGDALRLAVKLGLELTISTFGRTWVSLIYEDHGTDSYAATRRAIVRAAAALAP